MTLVRCFSVGKWLTLFLGAFVMACTTQTSPGDSEIKLLSTSLEVFPVESSIRALEIGPDGTVWFAGSNGRWGYSEDGGNTWKIDSLAFDESYPEYRAIAVTNDAVMLLSVASPALLYRSENRGETWELVYREDHEKAFYDAMAFWDDNDGIAMGDPTDECLSIIITRDGGATWKKVTCDDLPPAAEGEAAFAASNTNVVVSGNHAWIASGGAKSRIFHSADRGETWEVYDTPMNQGGTMTGMFTLAFYDESRGITFGGDWEDKSNNSGNKAITNDGGKTWELLTDGAGPGYRSCVQYVEGSEGKQIFAVGIPGVSYSPDGGRHWQLISDQDFYTIRIQGSTAWLAGRNKIARLNFSSD